MIIHFNLVDSGSGFGLDETNMSLEDIWRIVKDELLAWQEKNKNEDLSKCRIILQGDLTKLRVCTKLRPVVDVLKDTTGEGCRFYRAL